jgi:putative heme-binding domain-containing protein
MRIILGITLLFLSGFNSEEEPDVPRAVIAWPSGPLDVRIAFDRPIDASALAGLVGQTIAFGDQVAEIERPDWLKSVKKPSNPKSPATGGRLRIAAARLADEGRTLVLATDPHPRQETYVLALPPMRSARVPGSSQRMNLGYDLSGVEVAWDDGKSGASPSWNGWWPHLDPEFVKTMTKGSVEHERSHALLSRPGHLSLRTQVKLPAGKVILKLRSSAILAANFGGTAAKSKADGTGSHHVSISTESTGDPIELFLDASTVAGDAPFVLGATYQAAEDARERAIPVERLLLPWVPGAPSSAEPATAPPFSLVGGGAKRGEVVFYSEESKCATCHKIRGKGGDVGPDLSNLASRDAALIFRDINEPSATINPEFVPYTVALKDGQIFAGVARAEGADQLRILDTNAKATLVKRSEIEELRPSATSIMPVGLAGVLGEDKLRDLIAYLKAPAAKP